MSGPPVTTASPSAAPEPDAIISKDVDFMLKASLIVSGYLFSVSTLGSYLYKRTLHLEHIEQVYDTNTRNISSLTNTLNNMIAEFIQLRQLVEQPSTSTTATQCLSKFKERYPADTAAKDVLKLHLGQMYDVHIQLLKTYHKASFYKMEDISVPFPYAEMITHIIMLLLCIAVFTMLFINLNPFNLAERSVRISKCITNLDSSTFEDTCRASLAKFKNEANYEQGVKQCMDEKKTGLTDANINTCMQAAEVISQENATLFKISLTLAVITASAFIINLIASSTFNFQASLQTRNMF
jgi:hypothetical protein